MRGDAPWKFRRDTREGDMAHGITFDMWEREHEVCRGEAALGSRKAHLDGTVSLTLARDQHKYPNELIAQAYTTRPARVDVRRADGYSRVQVFLGPADAETAAMLEDIARNIREGLEP